MMLIGLIWAAFAPLLLVPVVVVFRFAIRSRFPRGLAWAVALGCTLAPVALVWAYGRVEFEGVCDQEAKAQILRTAIADGIFLNSMTANSFGMRYLQEEGFEWMEAPSIYKRGSFTRYSRKSGGGIAEAEVPGPVSARFEVREEHSRPLGHTSLTLVSVVDREMGEVIARAGSATFDGGGVKWVLGAYGLSSCPGGFRDPEGFNNFYHLARNTLRPR